MLRESRRNSFINNLKLRSASRPTKRYSKVVELSRRVVQLTLLLYKRPLQSNSINSLLNICWKKKSAIYELCGFLERRGFEQDRFIIFCYWYLNQFPAKFYKAIPWVIHQGILYASKYEANEPDIWKTVYDFANNSERGRRLVKLVRCERDHAPGFGYVKNKLEEI